MSKKTFRKNDSVSPYYVNNCSQGEGGWGERLFLRAPREFRVVLGTALGSRHSCVQLSNAARGPKKQQKITNLGQGKQKRACEKQGPEP